MTTNILAYVTNIKTGETTRYNDYPFDHVLKFHGKHYGIKSDGIYLLEGATDDGVQIKASFITAKNDFDSSLLKRVPYIFTDTDRDTFVTPHVDDSEYPSYSSNFAGKRTKLGRGIKGRYWSFEFSNVGGGEMRMRGFEIEPEVMTRRVPTLES